MQMWWQMYAWWSLLLALPQATGLAVWLWLSPTGHRVLDRVDPRCRAEHRLASLRLRGRISTTDYQRQMAELAHDASQRPFRLTTEHLA